MIIHTKDHQNIHIKYLNSFIHQNRPKNKKINCTAKKPRRKSMDYILSGF